METDPRFQSPMLDKNGRNNNDYDSTHVEVISYGKNVYLFEIGRHLME